MEVPVSITSQDHKEMIDLLNLCFREDGGSMLTDYPRHVGLSNQENIRVIKENGRIVSHVATSIRPVILGGIPTSVAGIGAVATHPDARGKGFASVLMEDTIKRSEEQGADIMLISNDLNLYRRHHARLCGKFPLIQIKKDDLKQQTGMEYQPAAEHDLDEIIRLHESLATRYLLPHEDMESLFKHKLVMDDKTDWWMIHDDKKPIGFGAIHPNETTISLHAWAGHPDALQLAVSFWFQQYSAVKFVFHAVNENVIPIHWKPFIKDHVVFEGSVIVLNGARLLDRAKHYIQERIGEQTWKLLKISGDKQQLSIRYQDELIKCSNGGDLAECLFGHPTKDFLLDKLQNDSSLYQILSKFLPLPLVWYGLGYV